MKNKNKQQLEKIEIDLNMFKMKLDVISDKLTKVIDLLKKGK